MKKTIKLIAVILALLMLGSLVLVACDNDEIGGAHVCGHKCATCGKCTDASCNDPACADKCPGHTPGEVHTCGHVCPTCGKCKDASCTDAACADKCPGHTPGATHACGHPCPICGKCLDELCSDAACADKCSGHKGEDVDSYISMEDYRAYLMNDLVNLRARIQRGGVSSAVMSRVDEEIAKGNSAIENACTIAEAEAAFKAAKAAIAKRIPLADGSFDFSSFSSEERTELLGILEEFAIANGMTGTTLYASAAFIMYGERVTLGSETDILGYGFGVLSEGSIDPTKPMESESNPAWKLYYHAATATDPGHVNPDDDKGSETSDFASYFHAGMYTTYMNAEKNGYDWTTCMAVGKPEAVGGLNEKGMAATWRVEVRQDLKYNTCSSNDRMGSYNNRLIALEDYLTPFKILLNAKNGWQRGSEFANNDKANGIVGTKAYYEATKEAESGANGISEADFSDVGLKAYVEGGKWYLEYTLNAPATPFFAMRYCPFGNPVPADFIEAIGGAGNYCKFGTAGTVAGGWSPVDTSLSVGPYTLEAWESNVALVYKKNPNFVHADTKYQIEGIHYKVLPAAKENEDAIFNEFLAGHLDAAGIPSTKLQEYKNNPLTRFRLGDSCFKLNMNALNAEDWDKFFGEDGSVKMTDPGHKWIVEPALSNAHFRSGLSFALNRKQIGDMYGSVGAIDYFPPHYLADPELGTAYNSTDAHKAAIAQLLGTVDGEPMTDDAGYDLELARDYFRMAISEMEAAGLYKPGTKENPTVISLEIAWQYPVNRKEEHQNVKKDWEEAFNHESVTGGLYRLEIDFYVGAAWSDVYYNKMLIGQFDIGFGSISGDSQNPISNMNVLSTNQTISEGFTLNWAIDTNDPDADILVYQGKRWSYDAIVKCTNGSTEVANGKIIDEHEDFEYGMDVIENEDGTQTVVFNVRVNNGAELDGQAFAIYSYDSTTKDYDEYDLDDAEEDGIIASEPVVSGNRTKYVYTLSAEFVANFPARDTQGFDLYLWGTDSDGKAFGSEAKPVDGFSYSIKNKVVIYQTIIVGYIAADTTLFKAGDFAYSVALTCQPELSDISMRAEFYIGDELIDPDKAFGEPIEIASMGLTRFNWSLSETEIAALIEGMEYVEDQHVVIYVSYKDAAGNEIVDELLTIYEVELIPSPIPGEILWSELSVLTAEDVEDYKLPEGTIVYEMILKVGAAVDLTKTDIDMKLVSGDASVSAPDVLGEDFMFSAQYVDAYGAWYIMMAITPDQVEALIAEGELVADDEQGVLVVITLADEDGEELDVLTDEADLVLIEAEDAE